MRRQRFCFKCWQIPEVSSGNLRSPAIYFRFFVRIAYANAHISLLLPHYPPSARTAAKATAQVDRSSKSSTKDSRRSGRTKFNNDPSPKRRIYWLGGSTDNI